MVRQYVQAAVRANASYQNTKWVLSQMLAGGYSVSPPTKYGEVPMKSFNRQMSSAKSTKAICELINEPFQIDEWPAQAHTTTFYRDKGGGAAALAASQLAVKAPVEEAAPVVAVPTAAELADSTPSGAKRNFEDAADGTAEAESGAVKAPVEEAAPVVA